MDMSNYAWVDQRSDPDFITEMYNQASTKAEYRIVELARQGLASRASIPEAGAERRVSDAQIKDAIEYLDEGGIFDVTSGAFEAAMRDLRDARAALSAVPRSNYRAGMLRAADIAYAWPAARNAAIAIRIEANGLDLVSTSDPEPREWWPEYKPVIVDHPDAGFSELVLMDTLVVWSPPDANGVEIGYAASDDGDKFSTRIGVRWPLPPAPEAAP